MAGVLRIRAGYCGGGKESPSYYDLGDHTEAVSIDFDPEILSYHELLGKFWESHDSGYNHSKRQYLHAVFFRDEEQHREAEASKQAVANASGRKVETEILPVRQFTYAEGYHQKYYLTQHQELRAFLEATYPNGKALADSTVAMRLNAILFSRKDEVTSELRDEIADYGLPEEWEKWVWNKVE